MADEGLERRIDNLAVEMRLGFQRVDARFEQVDHRFEQMDRRFVRDDERFESLLRKIDHDFEAFAARIEHRFQVIVERLEAKFELLIDWIQEQKRRLDSHEIRNAEEHRLMQAQIDDLNARLPRPRRRKPS